MGNSDDQTNTGKLIMIRRLPAQTKRQVIVSAFIHDVPT